MVGAARFRVVVASGGSPARRGFRPLRIAFLGCGFITGVHSHHLHLHLLRDTWRPSYASRDGGRAQEFQQRYAGDTSYDGYAAALADLMTDAVVVAVPPTWHLDLRGYRVMYRDFAGAVRSGTQPEMSLERALDDHRPIEQVARG